MAIEIIDIQRDGNKLLVTIEGDSIEEVISMKARKIAYEARYEHGFENSGIESFGGTWPVDKTKKNSKEAIEPLTTDQMKEISKRPKDIAYRHTFRMTRGI